jgi:hypothetical protein
MAYQCPRCGDVVRRGSSAGAGVAAGMVGMLLFAAFSSFQCVKCGPIPRSEFPPEARTEMLVGSVAMVAGAALLLVGVIYVLTMLNS